VIRRRRSCLAVPADDERKLVRAAASAADQVILDLEDAISSSRKEVAREIAARALRELDWSVPTVSVRINGPGTPWHTGDVAFVRTLPIATVVVPKVDRVKDLPDVAQPIEVLVETAAALVNCEAIASADGVEALVLGPGDLAASLGTPARIIGTGAHLDYARARILVAARAGGCAAIDGPYAAFTDEAGLRASAAVARALGFDGKWCIHPAQLEPCNELFTPTAEELEWAYKALGIDGADADGGDMVDAASRRIALALLARAPGAAP
jgi:citrate lyase subunit beta / citryl-CoA lyase